LGRLCSVCTSGSRDEIDSLLIAGNSPYAAAKATGLSESSIRRHQRSCLVAAITYRDITPKHGPMAPDKVWDPLPILKICQDYLLQKLNAARDLREGVAVIRAMTTLVQTSLVAIEKAQIHQTERKDTDDAAERLARLVQKAVDEKDPELQERLTRIMLRNGQDDPQSRNTH